MLVAVCMALGGHGLYRWEQRAIISHMMCGFCTGWCQSSYPLVFLFFKDLLTWLVRVCRALALCFRSSYSPFSNHLRQTSAYHCILYWEYALFSQSVSVSLCQHYFVMLRQNITTGSLLRYIFVSHWCTLWISVWHLLSQTKVVSWVLFCITAVHKM